MTNQEIVAKLWNLCNVLLFFTRGTNDKDNTKEVWFYDLRTNMPSFGKTNPLKKEHFDGFKAAYTAEDIKSISDERWKDCRL